MKEIEEFKYRDKGKDSLLNKHHYHNNCLEILHIISGKGVIVIKDKLYPFEAGSVFFINGKNAHCSVPEQPEKYVRNKIIFSRNYIEKILLHTNCIIWLEKLFNENNGMSINFTPEQSGKLDILFLKLNEKLKENTYDTNLKTLLCILSIMNIAIEHTGHYIPTLKNKISELLEYINKNLDKNLLLEELCEIVHMSKYHLCRTFKRTMDMTISEYILIMRLSKAKTMLTESDVQISEIVMSCGFSSFAYFSKIFKEYEKITPTQYRKKHQITK